jgi:hypothetical protein
MTRGEKTIGTATDTAQEEMTDAVLVEATSVVPRIIEEVMIEIGALETTTGMKVVGKLTAAGAETSRGTIEGGNAEELTVEKKLIAIVEIGEMTAIEIQIEGMIERAGIIEIEVVQRETVKETIEEMTEEEMIEVQEETELQKGVRTKSSF